MSKCSSCKQLLLDEHVLKCTYCRKAFCNDCWQKGVKVMTTKKKSMGIACEVCKALLQ